MHSSLKKSFLSHLAILWNSEFKWVYLSLSPLLFTSLLSSAILKSPQTTILPSYLFFFPLRNGFGLYLLYNITNFLSPSLVSDRYISRNKRIYDHHQLEVYDGTESSRAICLYISSVQFSRSVVSDCLQPHESQHARPPCPSPTPRVHSDSRPSSR